MMNQSKWNLFQTEGDVLMSRNQAIYSNSPNNFTWTKLQIDDMENDEDLDEDQDKLNPSSPLLRSQDTRKVPSLHWRVT